MSEPSYEKQVALSAFLDKRDYERSGGKIADRIAALEKRVADLEKKTTVTWAISDSTLRNLGG